MVAAATDILVAGSGNTAITLAVAVNQLVRNADVDRALKSEIRQPSLQCRDDYDLTSLERLPLLTACVKEALRSATAVPGRLPHIVPGPESGVAPLIVQGKQIPPGV
ncbi:hypothetical protein BDW62DRAFT_205027 [Aspergillus aurantiobrunneus]